MIVATTWPEALVGSVAIVAVAAVLIALIWQVFATGRAGISRRRNDDTDRSAA